MEHSLFASNNQWKILHRRATENLITPRGAIMTAVFLLGAPSHRPPEQRIGINA
jgi:hypothetical protein